MGQVCVVTGDSRTYYLIASRLRRAHISFLSAMPSEVDTRMCSLVLTTRREASMFKGSVMIAEDLDENPIVMKGQLAARLGGADRELVIGIDPGSRIGLAVFYAGTELAADTFNSRSSLYKVLLDLVCKIPGNRSVVKIGNGSPELATKLASEIGQYLPGVVIEIVDEEGTSARSRKYRGLPKDQSAAARIALRRGSRYRAS